MADSRAHRTGAAGAAHRAGAARGAGAAGAAHRAEPAAEAGSSRHQQRHVSGIDLRLDGVALLLAQPAGRHRGVDAVLVCLLESVAQLARLNAELSCRVLDDRLALGLRIAELRGRDRCARAYYGKPGDRADDELAAHLHLSLLSPLVIRSRFSVGL